MRNDILKLMNVYLLRDLSNAKHKMYHLVKKTEMRMKFRIKKFLKKNDRLQYPTTLQYPITNKCNLNCIMCNIHANPHNEIPINKLRLTLSDPVFKKIRSVGINGGEPFLLPNLSEYVQTIVDTLTDIQNLFIISNGTIGKNVLQKLPIIKQICESKHVNLTVSFSIDGYGKVHDRIRGKTGTFEQLMQTVDVILSDKNHYCDKLNFICTISTGNVYELDLLDSFARKKGIYVNYNIATEHERLKNEKKYDQYSLFGNPHALMMASEFLYRKYKETGHIKYFSLFEYLISKNHRRIDDCSNLKDSITLTANGDICYCATHSKVLGNILSDDVNVSDLYFGNEEYNKSIKNTYCEHCSHYMYGINAENYYLLESDDLRTNHIVRL